MRKLLPRYRDDARSDMQRTIRSSFWFGANAAVVIDNDIKTEKVFNDG